LDVVAEARGAQVPLGAIIREHGVLRREGLQLVLVVEGGGRWRLDMPRQGEALLGQLVALEGIRSGYDLLDVVEIGAYGNPVAPALRFDGALGLLTRAVLAALVVLGCLAPLL
jgi:hypothetical protein